MRSIFALYAVFCASSLLANPLVLDEVMSREDQKRTGVAYLSTNQRIVLEQWLNKNCNCPSRIAPAEEEKNLFVSINIDSGKKIQLNDNSIWDVDPRDYPLSEAWLASIPVKIVPSLDPDFPCLLVNRNTGVSIRVKKGEAPPPMPYHARPPTEEAPASTNPKTPAAPKTSKTPAAPTPAAPKTPAPSMPTAPMPSAPNLSY
jgi:hypothetical protein